MMATMLIRTAVVVLLAQLGAGLQLGVLSTQTCSRQPAPSRAVPSRRTWLQVAGAAAAALPLAKPALAAPDYAGARDALKAMIAADPDIGPTMLRLAWHSSGTYDAMSKTGGSGGGTIRFKEELAHGGNAGLEKMVA